MDHVRPDDTMTPYQRHATFGHTMTRYSPDGYQIIEECADCMARFLHDPVIGYPVTMYPERIIIAD